MPLELKIDRLSLENKTESWNGIELREFQRRVRDSNAPFVILDAPTGAGKTLAILSAFLRSGSKYGMLVYPTNELILDQAEGISKLLSKMRINATILTPFTSLATPAGVAVIGATTSDMLVAVVTGEALEYYAEEWEKTGHGQALEFLLNQCDKKTLILTNPDTILNILKLIYTTDISGGLKTRGTVGHLIEYLTQLVEFIAIDELHLYTGIMYANLIYSLGLLKNSIKKIIISSATHSETIALLKEIFPEFEYISAEIKPDGITVRHPTHLWIHPVGGRFGVLSPNNAANLVEALEELLDNYGPKEKALVIVNSVSTAYAVAKILHESGKDVHLITGIVGSSDRRAKIDAEIIVGTSCLEVGIDFDKTLLVMEGTNTSSLIQRLGRAGRHREGYVHIFVPSSAYEALSAVLATNTPSELEYFKFIDIVRGSMKDLPAYVDFAKSKYGVLLFASILYRWAKMENNYKKKIECLEQLYKNCRLPFLPEDHCWQWGKILALLEKFSNTGARGDIFSIPAKDEKMTCWASVDIFDINRFEYEIKNRPGDVPGHIRGDSVAILKGVSARRSGSQVVMYLEPQLDFPFTDNIKIFSKNKERIGIIGVDDQLRKIMKEFLAGHIYCLASEVSDWRFNWLPTAKDSGLPPFVIFGVDALLYKYHMEITKSEV